MKIKPYIPLLLLLTCLFPSLQAQYRSPYFQPDTTQAHQQAAEAMKQGNFAIAYCLWHPLAEQGDQEAQYNIGWMYHNGYGLSIDDSKALSWWLQAAARGSIDAHHALGELYANGQGVEKNRSIALGWFIAAALKGHNLAKESLLAMLTSKDAVAKNIFQQLLSSNWTLLGEPMEIRVERANTRRGPDKSFGVVSVLEQGHLVLPLQKKGDWIQVGITGSGKTAWIFHSLITRPAGAYSVE